MVPQRTGKSRHLGAPNRACRPAVLLFDAYAGQFDGYRHASVSQPPPHLYHLPLRAAARGRNHLGVVIGADAWTAAAMQRFARWTALVETTFLLPPAEPRASYRVRIFTPHKEIPFAGHPSIGSAH